MTTLLTLPVIAPIDDDVQRREFLGILAAAGVLAGCGTDGSSPTESADPGYPRSIDTPEGTTTVATRPSRIALTNGKRLFPFVLPFLAESRVEVVGYGAENEPDLYPWIPAELFTRPNSLDADAVDVERYASWRPEVIVANDNVGDLFVPLEDLAPVLRVPEADWRLSTRAIGELLGDEVTARRVLDETAALIARSRRRTPLDVAVISRYQDNGTVGFQTVGAELPNFLDELGLEATAPIPSEGYADVSVELMTDRLDAVDWVVVLNFGDDLQASLLFDPLFARSQTVARGNVVVLDRVQTNAGFPPNPPSMPTVIEALAPILTA